MYPFLEELFVRGAVRLFLGLELHEIYAHEQHEHRDENYGGKRVHIGRTYKAKTLLLKILTKGILIFLE